MIANSGRKHALETLFSKFSLQFQIVSNSVSMHALETLLSKRSLQFQNIVLNSIRMYHFTLPVFKISRPL